MVCACVGRVLHTNGSPFVVRLLTCQALAESFSESPGKFYKRSQEENTSPAAGFFLVVQPTPVEQDCCCFRSANSGRLRTVA